MKLTRKELRRIISEAFIDANIPSEEGKSHIDQPKKYMMTKGNPVASDGKGYMVDFDLNALLKDQALKWSMQFDKGDPSMAALGFEAWLQQVKHGIDILGDFLFEYGDIAEMIPTLPDVKSIYQDAVDGAFNLLILGHFYNNPDESFSWTQFVADSEDLKKEFADMGILHPLFVEAMGDNDDF